MSRRGDTGPSAVGCAFGFSWMGMGLGALVWLVAMRAGCGPATDLPDLDYARSLYGGCLAALAAGTVTGIAAGVVYARSRRRAVGSNP